MKKTIIISGLIASPAIASAAGYDIFSFLDLVMSAVTTLFKYLLPLATAAFFWNMIQMIKTSGEGNAEKMKQARNGIVFTGIALFLMVGIWTIVAYIQRSTGIDEAGGINNGPIVPGVTTPR